MSFNYAKLGNQCQSQTSALTSNAKYIMPLSSVYYRRETPMMKYPGTADNIYYSDKYSLSGSEKPEDIKLKSNFEDHHHEAPIQQHLKCSNCKTWN